MEKILQDNDVIKEALKKNEGVAFGRLGKSEILVVERGHKISASLHAGISPPIPEIIEKYRNLYVDAVKNVDFMFVFEGNWFTHQIPFIKKCKANPICISAMNLSHEGEFYQTLKNPQSWFHELSDKKVLIISSMTQSIKEQYEKIDLVYPPEKETKFPKFKVLHTIQAPMSQCMPEDVPEKTWVQHFEDLKVEINNCDFEIALLSCGGYALPLAHHIRTIGKKALHIGGCLQTYFGIIGARWEPYWKDNKTPVPNEHWKHPYEHERPKVWEKIEGGAYW